MSGATDWRRDYDEQGFAVLTSVIAQRAVAAAGAAYDALTHTAPTSVAMSDQPILVLWQHARGGFKRYIPLPEIPAIAALVADPAILAAVTDLCGGPVRLLETIVFNKPPGDGLPLAWHQDASFYPLAGGVQVSAAVMLDPADEANGTIAFAPGSHRGTLMSAVDLLTGARRHGDPRPLPDDPAAAGYGVVAPRLEPGDVVIFGDRIWHGSGPNRTIDRPRRLLSIRYISLDTRYHPVPGNAATFMRQIASAEGEPLAGSAFPILG